MSRILIWDLPTGLFHWLFTATVVVALAIALIADDDSTPGGGPGATHIANSLNFIEMMEFFEARLGETMDERRDNGRVQATL